MANKLARSAYIQARWAILKAMTVATGFVDTPDNGRFRIPRSIHPYTYWALRRGRYEQAETRVLEEEFKPDSLIIDVGSNIGFVSRHACKKLKPSGTLVCIEADPRNLKYLELNMADARRAQNVQIVAAAIGAPEHEGESCYFRQRRNLCSGLGEVARPERREKVIEVPMRSLSSIVDTFDIGQSGFSLVCDAEGAEILVVTKDPGSLRRCNQIAIELHHPSQTGSDITPDDIVRMLKELGFVHKRVVEDTHYFDRSSQQA